jgi:hypothetical protein
MLASITPLGERGRHSHYPVTVVAFLLGGAIAGALGGLGLGTLGALALGGMASSSRLILLAVALAAAIGIDLRPGSAPGPRRQVNEQWLDRYRGWVYGLGFGAQLGIGVSTIVTSAATYVAVLAALLSASPGFGALVLGLYGAARGLTPLLAARSQSTAQLMALHGRLARASAPMAKAGLLVLAFAFVLAVAGALA